MPDKWNPVPGYTGVYWISRDGDVRNAQGKYIAQVKGTNGENYVQLRHNGRRERLMVRALTAMVFGGNK